MNHTPYIHAFVVFTHIIFWVDHITNVGQET